MPTVCAPCPGNTKARLMVSSPLDLPVDTICGRAAQLAFGAAPRRHATRQNLDALSDPRGHRPPLGLGQSLGLAFGMALGVILGLALGVTLGLAAILPCAVVVAITVRVCVPVSGVAIFSRGSGFVLRFGLGIIGVLARRLIVF